MYNDKFEKMYNGKLIKTFSNEVKKDPKLKNLLLKLQYLAQIKKKVRSIYGTDDPDALLALVGKKVNSNIFVANEAYVNLKIISVEYGKLYSECCARIVSVGGSVEFIKK